MAKHQKALDRITAVPTPSDIRWEELTSVLSRLGYEALPGKGARRKFFHPTSKHTISIHEPHPSNIVKRVYIDMVVSELRQQGLID